MTRHTTLTSLMAAALRTNAARPATRIKSRSGWTDQTFAEFDDQIQRIARGLVDAGIAPGDRVGIIAWNRPEWSAVDFACLRIGAVSVPLYPSSTPEQVTHILRDCQASLVVAEDAEQAAKVDGVRTVTMDPAHGFETLAHLELPEGHDDEITHRSALIGADDLATLIYTSGTTGEPKGVMLHQGAFITELGDLDGYFDITPDDHSLAFLPLSHAFERAWTYYVLSKGCRNTYLHDPKQMAEALVEVRPTLLVSVPKLYEKVYSTAREKVADSALKRRIFTWALRVGGQAQRAHRKGKKPSIVWRAQLPLADRLVFGAIRDAIGGPKTALASGGAPLREEIEEFFSSAGVLVSQGYGLTETAPLISFNAPRDFKFGTVGKVMTSGQVRIGADGEILYRGPNVMQGYWGQEQETANTIDADGWLHTGDVGYVDTDGFLVITDRLKDILITHGGKNVAPQPIEGMVLTDPLFEHAVVLGDNRPCLTLLVSPSLPQLEDLAEELQVRWESRDELFDDPEILSAIRERLESVTSRLPSHEKIRDFRLLPEDFTLENGLLTPTLKVRRREVERRFAERIDDMYARLNELRGRGQR